MATLEGDFQEIQKWSNDFLRRSDLEILTPESIKTLSDLMDNNWWFEYLVINYYSYIMKLYIHSKIISKE